MSCDGRPFCFFLIVLWPLMITLQKPWLTWLLLARCRAPRIVTSGQLTVVQTKLLMARNTVDNISIRALQRTEIQTPFIQPFLYCCESSSVIMLLMVGLLMALKFYSLLCNQQKFRPLYSSIPLLPWEFFCNYAFNGGFVNGPQILFIALQPT